MLKFQPTLSRSASFILVSTALLSGLCCGGSNGGSSGPAAGPSCGAGTHDNGAGVCILDCTLPGVTVNIGSTAGGTFCQSLSKNTGDEICFNNTNGEFLSAALTDVGPSSCLSSVSSAAVGNPAIAQIRGDGVYGTFPDGAAVRFLVGNYNDGSVQISYDYPTAGLAQLTVAGGCPNSVPAIKFSSNGSGSCAAFYPTGTVVTLNYPGQTEVIWGGACANTPKTSVSCSVTMSGDQSVSAQIPVQTR